MGTEFQAILVGSDPDYLQDAGNQALEEVARLDERLSHYRADSEISDLNLRAPYEPVLLEPGLCDLMRRALALSRETDGAFDCTAGPLIRCWGFFRGQGRMPEPEAVRDALQRVGSRYLDLHVEDRTLRYRRSGVEVHLGGIGKGYAVDRVVAALRELRIEAALVHGGTSTVYGMGAPPGADAWEIGLCDPDGRDERLGTVRLKDRALSTSGDYEQFFELEGRRYSHILDPRTGEPARGIRSATVLADNATDTDALSTAAFVLGPDARSLCDRFPGIGMVLVPDPELDAKREIVVSGSVDLTLADGGTITAEGEND